MVDTTKQKYMQVVLLPLSSIVRRIFILY